MLHSWQKPSVALIAQCTLLVLPVVSTRAVGVQIRECLVALAVPALPEPPMVASLATEEEKVRESACTSAEEGYRCAAPAPSAVAASCGCAGTWGPG